MTDPLQHALGRLATGGHLTAQESTGAFGAIMRGEAAPGDIAALLLGLRAKGETAEELAGAVRALRDAMVPVHCSAGPPVVDTCGTGGGHVGTFNVSTAAAFVVAAAGARVAKHGNRSYTSKCGSADVLEALGVDIGLPPERAGAVLNAAGMVFLFAPTFHPAMRHVGPVRKQLGVPTIMNLVGPLANPARVSRQVVGVADAARGPLLAEALMRLGAEHALVVHGEVGMDEISPAGRTAVWEIRQGRVTTWVLDPEALGLAWDRVTDLAGGAPDENAGRLERLLEGEADEAARRAVALNAAAGLYVSGLVPTLLDASRVALAVLASRAGSAVLARLRAAAPAERPVVSD